MGASSDPTTYGEVTVFRFPEGRNIEGPSQVFARINQDPEFSQRRTLLGQSGSTVLFGDFLVIPIEDSFLYVQPVYVRSAQETAIPQLTFVRGRERQRRRGLRGRQPAGSDHVGRRRRRRRRPEPPDGGGTGSVEEQIQELLAQATEHFENAEAALAAGDLRYVPDRRSRRRKKRWSRRRRSRRATRRARALRRASSATPTASRLGDPLAVRRRQTEREVGFDVGDVHLRLLQVARVVPVHRLPLA